MFGRSAADPAALAARLAAHARSLGDERALVVLLDQPLLWAAPELRRQLAEQAAPRVEANPAAELRVRQACVAAEQPKARGEPAGSAAPRLHEAEQVPASAADRAAGGAAADWQPGPGVRAAGQLAACSAGGPVIVVADAAARHLDPGEDAAGSAGGVASTSGRVCAAGYTWELPAGVQVRHIKRSLADPLHDYQSAHADSLIVINQR